MAETKPDIPFVRDLGVKAISLLDKAKEKIESKINTKETHGKRDDIDENTPITGVKAPDVFERAKEEIQAIVETFNQKKESLIGEKKRDESGKQELKGDESESGIKSANLVERAKEEIDAVLLQFKSKETHGRSNNIDENTSTDKVKAPTLLGRAKEELEAIVDAVNHKKASLSDSVSSTDKESGFGASIGRGLEKVCSPFGKGLESVCSTWGSSSNKKD